jgi:hypothetical protein
MENPLSLRVSDISRKNTSLQGSLAGVLRGDVNVVDCGGEIMAPFVFCDESRHFIKRDITGTVQPVPLTPPMGREGYSFLPWSPS